MVTANQKKALAAGGALASFAAVGYLLLQSKAVTGQTSNFTLTVEDATTSAPVFNDCQVTVGTQTAQANASGQANFPQLPFGTYGITVTATGYQSGNADVVVNMATQNATIFLTPSVGTGTSTATAVVTNLATGGSISGASVVIGTFPAGTTGATGQVTFTGVPYGTYNLTATATGYNMFQQTVTIDQTTQSIYIQMIATGTTASTDMPTYIADYRSPTMAFLAVGLSPIQRLVGGSGGGNKNYIYWGIDLTQPKAPIPQDIASVVSFMVTSTTTNIYWQVSSPTIKQTQSLATTASGAQIASDGGPEYDQFTNLALATGLPTTSPNARCYNPVPSPVGPNIQCVLDSGGELRHSSYMLVSDPTFTKAYYLRGGLVNYRSNGEIDFVALIDSTSTATIDKSGTVCSCPALNFPAQAEVDWAVRSPPSFTNIKGNGLRYLTVGGNMYQAGTGALVLNQVINPAVQVADTAS
jgi:hypothetical protein